MDGHQKISDDIDKVSRRFTAYIKPGTVPLTDVDSYYQANRQDVLQVRHVIKKLQKTNVYADIKDPVVWQREIRQDRQLPGRE